MWVGLGSVSTRCGGIWDLGIGTFLGQLGRLTAGTAFGGGSSEKPGENRLMNPYGLVWQECVIVYLRVFLKGFWVKTLQSPKTLCYTTIPFLINTLSLLICLEERDSSTARNSIYASTCELAMLPGSDA
jgi:hypothetical protein